jgi:cation:H+ antiporter
MFHNLLLFAGGLVALVLGADALVRGASRLAFALGISPLVVGLTIVAFGTSAPEMAVTVGAVAQGSTDLAVANAVGSNTFNVLGILGLAAIITPLLVNVQVIRQEAPIMTGGGVLLLLLSVDGMLSLFDSALLLLLLLAYTVFLVRQSRAETAAAQAGYGHLGNGADASGPWHHRPVVQAGLVLAGLALLVGGSHAMVTAAVGFATALGVSEVVIGLTIVAIGTSLPEVAASLAAALKGERDMAVGNVVGSCTFNIFGVIGLGGVTAVLAGAGGLPVPESVRALDLWVMLAALFACLPVFFSGREISRWEGLLFVLAYAAYTVFLLLQARGSAWLPGFSELMLAYVLPLALVAVVGAVLRKGH